MKKFVSVILIITTTLSIVSGVLFYKPKQAKAAFFPLPDLNTLKEYVLDILPKTVARYAMVRLQQEVARWAKGGFTDENAPFTMTNWGEEIKNALDLASAKFIEEFNLTKFCSPLNYTLGEFFGIGIPYGGEVPYYEYAACTMDTVVDNVEAFWENPSLAIYGWDAWTALSQPQNNFIGSFLMAATEKAALEEAEKAQKELEKDTGSGYKNENECVRYQEISDEEMDKCKDDCFDKYGGKNDVKTANCYTQCNSRNTGICLEYKTKNLGSTIQSSVEKAIGSDMDWLITADEITEMLNLVFSALFNKMINGLGLNSTTTYTASQQNFKYNSEYSYYTNFKKALIQEDVDKLRTNILDSILRSIKSLTTAGYTCEEGAQLEGDVYHEVIVEILEQESQHLYVGMEGVDIKPDYTVLDNAFAVNAGKAIYGETWDDVPAFRYPDKCAQISGGGTCKSIKNNLPFEVKVENIKPDECANTSGVSCLETIYNNINSGLSENEAIKKATTDMCDRSTTTEPMMMPCCSTYGVGKTCLDAGYLIDGLKNTCNECLKNGEQQCENIANATEKENCLKIHCSNFQNIPQLNPASIPSASEFYKRCQLVRLKENCNVCLKEYFMPASYCQEIDDFINRAFVKYPALVKYDSWFGRKNLSFPCEKNGSSGKQVPLGLICRILPDFGGVPKEQTVSGPGFSFTSTAGEPPPGEKNLCQKRCNVTYEELKSLIDNKPGDGDCNPIMYTVNATTPTSGKYIQKVKAKCCAALWWTGSDMSYEKCRDTEKQEECTWAKPVNEEPWCYCPEGYRPLGFARTGGQGAGDRGGDCHNTGIDTRGEEIYVYSNNDPNGTDVFYIGAGSCSEANENLNNTDMNPEDGIADGTPTDATGPNSTTWSVEVSAGVRGEWYLNIPTGTYNAGTYHNSNDDVSSGIHICEKCNLNDPNYPYYGTDYYDQCNGKAQ